MAAPSRSGPRSLSPILVALSIVAGCASASRGPVAPPAGPAAATPAAATPAAATAGRSTKTSSGSVRAECFKDDQNTPAERAELERVALTFASRLFGPAPETARELMTTQARESATDEETKATIANLLRASGPLRDFKVAHTYLVEVLGVGLDTRALCGRITDNQWVSVAVRVGTRQAYVSLTALSLNNEWAMSLWFLPGDGTWKLHGFHIDAAGVSGRDANAFFALAKKERLAGHAFNAGVLYNMARALLERGPSFQLGLVQAVAEDAASLSLPPDFQGSPPFLFHLGESTYTIGAISPTGLDGQLGLVFALPQDDWPGTQGVIKTNRRFLTAFMAAYPEVLLVFQFLVARAERPDRSASYGTVYRVGKGFDADRE